MDSTVAGQGSRSSVLRIAVPIGALAVFAAVGAYLIFGQKQSTSEITYVRLTQSTQSYTILLQVVSPQSMYTPEQVKQENPTEGEVMFAGTMVMPPGMGSMSMSTSSYPAGWRHIEVHIYDRSTNSVIANASPVMTVSDDQSGQATTVPIVTMQSVVEGASDLHYGNNAYLPSGHSYTLTVTVAGETATFHFKLQS